VLLLDWRDATSKEKSPVPLRQLDSNCFYKLPYFLPRESLCQEADLQWVLEERFQCLESPLAAWTLPGPGLHTGHDLTTFSSVWHLSLVTAATLDCHI
jgi:hypothetical protein